VDIAEDVGDSGVVEHNVPRRAGFVETEVKTFSLKKRENVVKEGIPVGEFHYGSHWHN
jgi:hypothetical protein